MQQAAAGQGKSRGELLYGRATRPRRQATGRPWPIHFSSPCSHARPRAATPRRSDVNRPKPCSTQLPTRWIWSATVRRRARRKRIAARCRSPKSASPECSAYSTNLLQNPRPTRDAQKSTSSCEGVRRSASLLAPIDLLFLLFCPQPTPDIGPKPGHIFAHDSLPLFEEAKSRGLTYPSGAADARGQRVTNFPPHTLLQRQARG